MGSRDDINVKDENLAELALTQAKAIKDCEHYVDGTQVKKMQSRKRLEILLRLTTLANTLNITRLSFVLTAIKIK